MRPGVTWSLACLQCDQYLAHVFIEKSALSSDGGRLFYFPDGRGNMNAFGPRLGWTFLLYIIPLVGAAQQPLWYQVGGPGGEPFGALAIDSSGVVYAGGPGYLTRSTDRGQSWTRVYYGDEFHTIFIRSDGVFWAGDDNGIWISTDKGSNLR
jgi:hypothetical protein